MNNPNTRFENLSYVINLGRSLHGPVAAKVIPKPSLGTAMCSLFEEFLYAYIMSGRQLGEYFTVTKR